MPTIWIDGDACPKAIKIITFKAATRTQTPLIIVANHLLTIPGSPYLRFIQVSGGFDVVDDYISNHVQLGDLVITADLPFAHRVVEQSALALNPRGTLYTPNNINQLLAQRNTNETLRGSGMITGGPSSISPQDIQRYANQLDQILRKLSLK